jgi:hypothetical protein
MPGVDVRRGRGVKLYNFGVKMQARQYDGDGGGEEGPSPTIKGIFAIITLVKFTLDPLLSPNLVPCSLSVCLKVFVSFSVIAVDRVLRRFDGIVVAIV